jgi:hypothetical protein
MTINTKDLYLGNVGVGTTAPYQNVPATAIVDEFGNIISEFKISAGIVTVTNIVDEVEIKNDSGSPIPVISGLEIPYHNQISLTYDVNSNITGVAYSVSSVGVATLSLTYDGNNNLTFIERS